MPFGKLDAIIFNMETIKFKDLEDPKIITDRSSDKRLTPGLPSIPL